MTFFNRSDVITYLTLSRLYNDVGFYLDEKFRAAYNLTYYTIAGRTNVDTSKFRRAIWNYIQCIYGIRHDDYDYGEVNQLLDRSLKMFIKTACCFPERITKPDYDSVLVELQHSEKVGCWVGVEFGVSNFNGLVFFWSLGPRESDDSGGAQPGGIAVRAARDYALHDMIWFPRGSANRTRRARHAQQQHGSVQNYEIQLEKAAVFLLTVNVCYNNLYFF